MIRETELNALYAKAMKLTRDPEQASDLVQDTVCRALEHWNKYKEEFSLSGWLYRIMFNLFINGKRRNDVVNRYLWECGVNQTEFKDPAALLTEQELNKAVDDLKELHRTPLRMSMEGYGYDEIAEALSIPIGTVKSRLNKARSVVRQRINQWSHVPKTINP